MEQKTQQERETGSSLSNTAETSILQSLLYGSIDGPQRPSSYYRTKIVIAINDSPDERTEGEGRGFSVLFKR